MFALDHFKNFQCDRTTERCPAKRARMCPRRKKSGKFLAHPKCADRKSATERFRHRYAVGEKRRIGILPMIFGTSAGSRCRYSLPALKFSCPKMTGLHLVK